MMFEKIFDSKVYQIGPLCSFFSFFKKSEISIVNNYLWNQKRILNNQFGQGLLEYILLLLVAVVIAIGLLGKFIKPFGAFTSAVGGRFECALEMGKLMDDKESFKLEDCATKYQSGKWNVGASSGGSSSSGAGSNGKSSSGGSSSGSNSTKNNSTKGENKKPGQGDIGKAGSNSSSSGSEGEKANSGSDANNASKSGRANYMGPVSSSTKINGIIGRNGKVVDSGKPTSNDGASDQLNISLEDREDNGNIGKNSQFFKRNRRSTKTVAYTESFSEEEKKAKKENKDSEVVKANKNVDSNDRQAKHIKIQKSEDKKSKETTEESWSIGKWLRFAIIFLIILAILLFLFFQIMQFSKDSE